MITLSATIPRNLSKCEKPSNILINVPKIKTSFNKTFNNTFVFNLKKTTKPFCQVFPPTHVCFKIINFLNHFFNDEFCLRKNKFCSNKGILKKCLFGL